jgi:putative transposase
VVLHFGTAGQVQQQRQATLHAAYHLNPNRFRHRHPEPPKLPAAAWINQPSREAITQSN